MAAFGEVLWTAEIQINGIAFIFDEFCRLEKHVRIVGTELQTTKTSLSNREHSRDQKGEGRA